MDTTKAIQKSGLEEIVEKFTKDTMLAVTNLIGQLYKENIENYLNSKKVEIESEVGKISNNTKQNLLSYLDFLVSSGKVYEYSFGAALKNTGYLPRTVEDVISRSSNQEEREKREMARYLTKVSFMMIPQEIQNYLARKPINEVQRTISESFEKELVYLKNYLLNKGVNEKEIESSIYLTLTTLSLFPELVSKQYLTLSRIFKPEVLEGLMENTVISSKDSYKKLYTIVLDALKIKEEPKKEELKSDIKTQDQELEKKEKAINDKIEEKNKGEQK